MLICTDKACNLLANITGMERWREREGKERVRMGRRERSRKRDTDRDTTLKISQGKIERECKEVKIKS